MPHNLPFYGKKIVPRNEEKYIENLLKKYKHHEASEELKKKIWDDLQKEKYLGNITIPFKLAVRLDPSGKFPSFIEVILDTKV